jgi:capsular exopolysaccharide synthesis family protein
MGVAQALELSPDEPRHLVLMVTSAVPNEGKSTIALALARSYALAGKSTLLIDGDLRVPSLHRFVGLQPKYGLLDYLSSPSDGFKEVVHHDPKSSAVLLLGAGRSSMATHQIVSDKGFRLLLKAARQTFEVVIVDTSPLVPVVDGLQIAGLVDAVVFVVRLGKTAQQDAKKALISLQAAARGKPIVLALNQQELSQSEYARRYSNYYAEAID